MGFVQLGWPAATPSVLVYYQSVSFNPHSKILISVEWKGTVLDKILGQVYGVSWADAVDLCLSMSNHLLSTMKETVEDSLRSQPSLYRPWGVLLYSPKPSPLREFLKSWSIGPNACRAKTCEEEACGCR